MCDDKTGGTNRDSHRFVHSHRVGKYGTIYGKPHVRGSADTNISGTTYQLSPKWSVRKYESTPPLSSLYHEGVTQSNLTCKSGARVIVSGFNTEWTYR